MPVEDQTLLKTMDGDSAAHPPLNDEFVQQYEKHQQQLRDVRLLDRSPPDPLAMIMAGVQQGFSPEQLGQLIGLKERLDANAAREAYNLAMAACQEEMPVVVRDSTNNHTGSDYASLDRVAAVMRPVYTRHGLSLGYTEAESPAPGLMRLKLNVRHKRGHGEWFQLDLPVDGTGSQGGKSAMNAVQGRGSTTSYGRRYLAAMAFNLVIADTDIDGNAQVQTLTPEEVGQVNDLYVPLLEGGKIDSVRFFAWIKCERLDQIPRTKLKDVLDLLRKKGGAK